MPKQIKLPTAFDLIKFDRREFLRTSGGLGAFALAGLAGCGPGSNDAREGALAPCRICEVTAPDELSLDDRRDIWLRAMNDPKVQPILMRFEELDAIPPGTALSPQSYVDARPEMLGSVWQINYKYEGSETIHPVVQLRSDSFWGPNGAVVSTLITAVNDPQYTPVGMVITENGSLTFLKGGADRGEMVEIQETITRGFDLRPTAVIGGPASVVAAQEAIFSAEGSSVAPGRRANYSHWNFDDGSLNEGTMVRKSWDVPGTYTVRLKVFDNNGYSGAASHRVTVTEA